jgi:hypothetical protein
MAHDSTLTFFVTLHLILSLQGIEEFPITVQVLTHKFYSGVLGTFFGLYICLTLVTVAEIVLYTLSYLHSSLYLFLQIIKTSSSICIWTVLFLYPFVVLDRTRQPLEASVFMGMVCLFLQYVTTWVLV